MNHAAKEGHGNKLKKTMIEVSNASEAMEIVLHFFCHVNIHMIGINKYCQSGRGKKEWKCGKKKFIKKKDRCKVLCKEIRIFEL